MTKSPSTLAGGAIDTAAAKATTSGSGGEEASPRSPLDVEDVPSSSTRSHEDSTSVARGPPPPKSTQTAANHASGSATAGGEASVGAAEGICASLTRTAVPSPRRAQRSRSLFQPPNYSSSPVAVPPLSAPPEAEAYYSYGVTVGGASQEYYQQPYQQQQQQQHQ